MKKIFVFMLCYLDLFAVNTYKNLKKLSLEELFNKGYYTYICNRRWQYINKYNQKREDLLSIVAYSCLKKGYLIPALDLAKVLNETKESRKNATYIVTLFLMKKLIMQVIKDGLNLNMIKLPVIKDNLLGIVFENIKKGNYKKENNVLIIIIDEIKYKIWISKDNNVYIGVFKNGKLIKREIYW